MMTVYIDGASSGNPGKIGIGYVIYKGQELVKKESVFLGVQSNNFAEYIALVFALIDVLACGEKSCEVFSDSKLLCEQIAGNYKVKNNNIFPLFVLSKHLISQLEHCSLRHIARELNADADALAKKATGFLI